MLCSAASVVLLVVECESVVGDGVHLHFVGSSRVFVSFDVSIAVIVAVRSPDDGYGDEDEEEGELPVEGEEELSHPNLVFPREYLNDELEDEDDEG